MMNQVTKGEKTEKIKELIKAGKTNQEIWAEVGGKKSRIYNTRASLKARKNVKRATAKIAKAEKIKSTSTIETKPSNINAKLRELIFQQAREIAELKLRLL